MAFLTYLFCTVFIQLATGQIVAYNGQGAGNTAQYGNFFNGRSLSSYSPLTKNMGSVAPPNFARNVAKSGNGLSSIANRNSANLVSTSNILRSNTNPNLVTPNTAIPNLSNTLSSAKAVAVNLDSNVARPNLANAASLVKPQSPRSPANVANPTLSRNIAGNIASPQYNLGSSYNSPAQNYNSLKNSNFASNLANTNIASANRGSLPNTWYPNTASSYSQSALHGPGGQQYGLRIEADDLKIAGNVEVTGSLPFYGTVSFNDKVPTGGAATVNYVCSG